MSVASPTPPPSPPAPAPAATVRTALERVLHPWRRRLARRRLARLAPPASVLFVCQGNACRSPFAAAVARHLLPADTDVDSAGFMMPRRRSPSEAIAAAAERGLDLSAHRSQLATTLQLRNAEVVVVMDVEQRRRVLGMQPGIGRRVVILGDLDPEPIADRAVPDPVNQALDAFRSAYARIERCVEALVGLWHQGPGREPRG